MSLLGRRILHYEILEPIGAGGMGEIFKARDTRLQREIALKFLPAQYQHDEQAQARLRVEAQAIARLDHPNIGVVHSLETAPEGLFLCLAYYSGQSLQAQLKTQALPLERCLGIARQILTGLQHAHDAGVIHRDIKPGNILLTDDQQLKIIDFGLAKLPELQLTQKGQLLGSMAYMSPEQIMGQVKQQTDIWACSVVLFEMLTGSFPFEGQGPNMLLSILKKPADRLADYGDYPASLQEILDIGLAKAPEERFQQCQEFIARLDALDAKTQPREQAVAIPLPVPRSPRKRKAASLIGREVELQELIERLQEHYLITIVGQGGAGKTRLAEALIQQPTVQQLFPDGIFFIALEAIDNLNTAIATIAKEAGLAQDSFQEGYDFFADQQVLLVLDNIEHLLEEIYPVIEGLLAQCPQLAIVSTSREVLNHSDELIFDLKGLSVPQHLGDDFETFGASRLFIQRAKLQRRSFDSEQEKEAILALCQLLEGWPLGIELAVSWIRQLPLSDIVKEITHNIDFLSQRSRNQATQRHQSIRAVFDYSWHLLSPKEQASFIRLAVFSGDFSAEAAWQVAGGSMTDLASLVDKSLLAVSEEGRYSFHPLLVQFAREKQTSDVLELLTQQHFSYYSSQVLDDSMAKLIWLESVAQDYSNIRAALHYGFDLTEAQAGLRLLARLGDYWFARGLVQEAQTLLSKGLENFALETEDRVRVLNWLAKVAFRAGDYPQAKTILDQAYELASRLAFQQGQAIAMMEQGAVLTRLGDFEQAQSRLEQGLALSQDLGNDAITSESLKNLGLVMVRQGNNEQALAYYQQSLELAQQLDDKKLLASLYPNLAGANFFKQDYDQAHYYCEQAQLLFKALGNTLGEAMSLNNLGMIAAHRGDAVAAMRHYQECLHLCKTLKNRQLVLDTAQNVAHLLRTKQPLIAAKLWGAAEALGESFAYQMPPRDQDSYHKAVAAAQQQSNPQVFTAAWQQGRSLHLEQIIDLCAGLSLP